MSRTRGRAWGRTKEDILQKGGASEAINASAVRADVLGLQSYSAGMRLDIQYLIRIGLERVVRPASDCRFQAVVIAEAQSIEYTIGKAYHASAEIASTDKANKEELVCKWFVAWGGLSIQSPYLYLSPPRALSSSVHYWTIRIVKFFCPWSSLSCRAKLRPYF